MSVSAPAADERERQPPRFQTLEISAREGIGLLLLARPDEANAMSPQMLRELPEATAWLAQHGLPAT